MHAILARLYHVAEHALHILHWQIVQGVVVAVLVAGLGRLVSRPVLAAGLAVLSGWLVITWPLVLVWPEPPLARLPGAAILLLLGGGFAASTGPAPVRGRKGTARKGSASKPVARRRWWARPLLCLLLAWWLRGAPFSGNAILNGMALFLGLLAAWAIAGRLASGDRGWGIAAAAVALAGSLDVAGVSPHWVWLAAVPAGAALALLGAVEAMPALVGAITITAAATVIASDRGRFLPADVACLVPLLSLVLAPRLLRPYPAAGAALAAGLGMAITYVARSGLPALR
jgi:hypothetical protein